MSDRGGDGPDVPACPGVLARRGRADRSQRDGRPGERELLGDPGSPGACRRGPAGSAPACTATSGGPPIGRDGSGSRGGRRAGADAGRAATVNDVAGRLVEGGKGGEDRTVSLQKGRVVTGVCELKDGQDRTVSPRNRPDVTGVSGGKGGQDWTLSRETPAQTPAETPASNARAGREPQNPRTVDPPNPPEGGSGADSTFVEETYTTERGRRRRRRVMVDLDAVRAPLLAPPLGDWDAWEQLRGLLLESVGESGFEIWLERLELIAVDRDGSLVIDTPVDATRAWVQERFGGLVERCAARVGRVVRFAQERERLAVQLGVEEPPVHRSCEEGDGEADAARSVTSRRVAPGVSAPAGSASAAYRSPASSSDSPASCLAGRPVRSGAVFHGGLRRDEGGVVMPVWSTGQKGTALDGVAVALEPDRGCDCCAAARGGKPEADRRRASTSQRGGAGGTFAVRSRGEGRVLRPTNRELVRHEIATVCRGIAEVVCEYVHTQRGRRCEAGRSDSHTYRSCQCHASRLSRAPSYRVVLHAGLQSTKGGVVMVVTIANHKRGVGKTTSAISLAALLARHGRRVLAVDLDPRFALTRRLGVKVDGLPSTLADVLARWVGAGEAIVAGVHGIDVLPGSRELAGVELGLAGEVGRETVLHEALGALDYEVVLIDTPSNLGLLTVNALVAADLVVAPTAAGEEGAAHALLELCATLAKLTRVRPTLPEVTVIVSTARPRRVTGDVIDEAIARLNLQPAIQGTSTDRGETLVSSWPSARASATGVLKTTVGNRKDDQ